MSVDAIETTLVLEEQLLHEIVAAGRAHRGWLTRWHRQLLCRLPPNAEFSGPNGHGECRFGKWYDASIASFRDLGPEACKSLHLLGRLHLRVHEEGRRLSETVDHGSGVDVRAYDAFAQTAEAFVRATLEFERALRTRLADHDPLTDVANRRSMDTRLEDELERLREGDGSAFLAMLDVDHFKQLNDAFGHQVGDEVLRRVVAQIRGQLRPYDMLFRYGGDEFLLCLRDVTLESAKRILERTCVNARSLASEWGWSSLTLSIGVCELEPSHSVEEAIQLADAALYRAKRDGRARVHALAAQNLGESEKNE